MNSDQVFNLNISPFTKKDGEKSVLHGIFDW